ncbi:MAG: hypothetical protein NVS2B12_18450 [Ktedonobacteraceae bacterium]
MGHSEESNSEVGGKYFRSYMWSNMCFARFIVLLANIIGAIERPLPAKIRVQGEGFVRLLKLLAQLIVQPAYVRRCIEWRPTIKGMLDGAVLGGGLGFWTAFYLIHESALLNVLVWIIIIGIALLFALLTSFLFVSGDVYFGPQDEFQKATSNEASVTTLRITFFLLLLLFVVYLIKPAWRDAVYFHLSALYFIGRITYLFRLTQLRWQEIADIEIVQDVGTGMQTMREA